MSMTSKDGMRVKSGAGIHPGRILYKAASGTTDLTSVRFFDGTGLQLRSQIGGSPITLPLTSTYKSLKDLVEGLGAEGVALWSSIESAVEGVMTSNVSAEVHASYGEENAVVPTQTFAVGRPLMVGIGIPDELKGLSGGTVNIAGEVEVATWIKSTPWQTIVMPGVGSTGWIDTNGAAAFYFDPIVATGGPIIQFEGRTPGGATIALPSSEALTSSPSYVTSTRTATVGQPRWVPCRTVSQIRVTWVSTGTALTFNWKFSGFPPIQFVSQANGAIAVQATSTGLLHGSAVGTSVFPAGLDGRSADGTAVTTGQNVRALGSLVGKEVNLPYALPGQTWSYAAASGGITNTTDVVLRAAGGAGVRNYLTSLQVTNESATATEVVIKDGAAVIWRDVFDGDGPKAGSVIRFDPPLRGSANTALNVACITTGTKTYVNAQGYFAAE